MGTLLKNDRRFYSITITVICLLAMVSGDLVAQDVANGQATATVLAALTVTAVKDLVFGNVLQGVQKPVSNLDADAGIFSITGASSAGISFYMVLPEYVSLTGDSDRMTISFTATDANIDTTGLSAADPTAFLAANGYADENPRNLSSTNFEAPAATIYIYMGGKVTPTVDQTAGAYTGDILLTVAYDGT